MAKELDVYKAWLGIAETARPLNHYQLLRLKNFEDDASKVRENYRKMNAHVRKYSAGEFGPQSQALLNELAKAMLCLTDSSRKLEYDAGLGRKAEAGVKRTFEELLILRKLIDNVQLAKARNYANTVGLEIRDAVLQQKLAGADQVMPIYAESVGLPYVELADIGIDEALIPKVPAYLARRHSCTPIMVDDGVVLMASPNPIEPDVEEELRLRIGMPVRSVFCTPAAVNEVIAKYYPKDAVQAEQAAKSSAPPKPAAAGAPAAAPVAKQPDTPEAKKTRRMTAFMAFNFSFMATVLYMQLFTRAPTMTTSLMYGAVAGLVIGGGAFAYLEFKK